MSSTPSELLFTFRAADLRKLLFGDDELMGVSPKSKYPGDTAKVLVISNLYGQLISQIDAAGEYFHVEFISGTDMDTSTTYDHAELWLAKDWRESNARREKFVARNREDNATRDKRSSRIAEISKVISSQHPLPEGYCRELAKTILDNAGIKDLSQVLTAIKLTDLLAKYEEEDKTT